MKPLRLTIEGINSFIEPRTVDFTQLAQDGIFCICGPTGSGKTTVLDCIILALYAPREHHRGTLKEYINTKCEKGKITLDFTAGGTDYRVYREIRRNSASAARLSKIDTGEVLADKADTVTDKIKDMLKLSKDDFTKVVVLEQGRFAEFMQMTKADRCKTISKLFGLERFEKLKETVSEAKKKYERQLAESDAALAQYAGVTEAALADKKKEVAALKASVREKREAVQAAEKTVREAEAVKQTADLRAQAAQLAASAQEELRAAEIDAERFAAQAEDLRIKKEQLAVYKEKSDAARTVLAHAAECERDAADAETYRQKREKAAADYREADGKAKTLSEQLQTWTARQKEDSGGAAAFGAALSALGYGSPASEAAFAAVRATAAADAERLAAAVAKRDESAQKAKTAETYLEALFVRGNELEAKIAAETAALSAAKEAYESARRANAAAVVRGALHGGDVCPVCGGVYRGGAAEEETPLAERLRAVEEREKTLAAYVAERQKNEVEHSRYAEMQSTAKSALAEAEKALCGKTAAHAAQAALQAQKGENAARDADAAARKTAELTAALAAAESAREAIKADGLRFADEIKKAQERIRERLGGQSVPEASAAAREAIEAFERAEKETNAAVEAWQKASEGCAAKKAAALERLRAAQSTLRALPETAFDAAAYAAALERLRETKDALSDGEARFGVVTEQAENLKRQLERKKELTHAKKRQSEILDNVLRLYKCVSGENRLFSFVAEEYVQSVTYTAGITLHKLTGGKYTLLYENGDFYVADFFADNDKRKVRTLSGGETFLASMSLAMAISQAISAQNYEFFFLDEGFGTLHERAMETVADALYALSRETTVGIVTHRTELADRIAARLNVVPATEDAGSDFTVSGV